MIPLAVLVFVCVYPFCFLAAGSLMGKGEIQECLLAVIDRKSVV